MIYFFVPGEPRPQGSKKTFINPKWKKNVAAGASTNGVRATFTVNTCENLADWRTTVKQFAQAAYQGPLLDGPVHLILQFVYTRPKSHYGTGKNSTTLKPNAPHYKRSAPDTGKLRRAVEDSLTKVVWTDDSRVARGWDEKIYGDKPGVHVKVMKLEDKI